MSFVFTDSVYGQKGIYGVEYNSLEHEEKSMFEINSHLWSAVIIDELIDKIQSLNTNDEFDFQIEGSHLFTLIDHNEVHFYSDFNTDVEADLIWPTKKFIDFLEKFKAFMEQNSIVNQDNELKHSL